MPHIHLETTSDLEENGKIPDILEALTANLASHETIASKAIRASHSLRSVWLMGEGAPAGYAHCEVAILGGRTLEIRQEIAKSMMGVLHEQFAESLRAEEVGLTLDLREMDKDTYQN